MIWTHWGLVLRAHRLAARSPINSFLLKWFARQHKSILFCLVHVHPCEICHTYLYTYIYFFQMSTEHFWLTCIGKKSKKRKEKKNRAAVVWHYWNINFNIDFHKRCICDYLIFLTLNRAKLHIILSLVLRQN